MLKLLKRVLCLIGRHKWHSLAGDFTELLWCENCRSVVSRPKKICRMKANDMEILEGDIYWNGEKIVVVEAVEREEQTGRALSVMVRSNDDIISLHPSQLETLQ